MSAAPPVPPSAATPQPAEPASSPVDADRERRDLDVRWAGRVVFPRSPAELRSTSMCPACQAPLRDARCPRCALDLTHAAAIELAEVSQRAADLLDARVALIGRIRRETTAATAASAATASTDSAPSGQPAAATTTDPALAPALAPPIVAAPVASRSGRSGVQVALTVVGISLLAVFAIFGVVYAFVTFGEGVRFTIIAAGTAATLAAAAMLARRGLTATAEGVALLGTLVLVLDAWALRASDAAGLGAPSESAYWGVALAVIGVVCGAWSRWGRLGGPALAAVALAPLGTALLVGDATTSLDAAMGSTFVPAASTALGAAAAIAVAAAHPLLRRPQRPGLALVVAAVATAVAGLLAIIGLGTLTAALGSAAAPTVLLAAVLAVTLALHVVVLGRAAEDDTTVPQEDLPVHARVVPATARVHRVLAAIVAGLAVVVAVLGSLLGSARWEEPSVALAVPLLLAVLLVVVLEPRSASSEALAGRTVGAPIVRAGALRAALLTAAALAAIAGGVAGVVALGAPLEAALASTTPFAIGVDSTIVQPEPGVVIAIAALALAAGVLAAGWAARGRLRERARGLAPLLGALLVIAVPLLETWWAVVAASSTLALLAAVALHRVVHLPGRDDRRALVAGLSPVAVGGAVLSLLVAPAVAGAWIIGVAVALITIAVCRALPARRPVRAVAVALGGGIVIASAWPAHADLAAAAVSVSIGSLVVALAALVVLVSALGALVPQERRAASAVALVAGTLGVAALGGGMPDAVPIDAAARTAGAIAQVIASALALIALVAVVLRARRSDRAVSAGSDDRRVEALLAATLLGPAAVLLALSSLSAADRLPRGTGEVVPALALVAVAGASLTAALRPTAPTAPTAPSPGALRRAADAGVGVTLLLVVASAVGAGLSDPGFGTVPNPLLPLVLLAAAVAVLLIAVSRDGLVGSGSRRRRLGWVALALGVAALWAQLVREAVREPEPFALPVAGALLLLAAWIARSGRGARGASALVGGGLVLAGVPIALASGDQPLLRGAVAAVVAGGLALLAAHRRANLERLPGSALAVAGATLATLAALTIAQTTALVGSPVGTDEQVRAVLLVVVLADVGLGAWFAARSREAWIVTAGGVGLAALAAGALGIAGIVDPVELLSLPLALALLAIGTLALERDDHTRSGRWLGPGLIALLVPSLLAVERDPELWRVVALGIVATAAFVGGVVRRLRAPVLIGGSVLLVHLVVQSWPLLRTIGESVEWWLWLGLAGIAVVAIAARYERRLQDARALVRRIRDLR
ncbi:SCO7613 C-terminal domain-containing membrane protein [Microcella alkalica]|uniref:SCO7613 C-terminal domain-containing membrane protein n=1 Tax=Microcella alkalica TaxID=355930 RepID=UPI00145D9B4C|nr:hypothetical protein [Microcella alkalica]